jgi:hypothetical protein
VRLTGALFLSRNLGIRNKARRQRTSRR